MGPQAQHRAQEQEHGARGPGLRGAGHRIGNGNCRTAAVEAAEQLRQAEVREVLGSFEHSPDEQVRLFVEAVALEARDDQ